MLMRFWSKISRMFLSMFLMIILRLEKMCIPYPHLLLLLLLLMQPLLLPEIGVQSLIIARISNANILSNRTFIVFLYTIWPCVKRRLSEQIANDSKVTEKENFLYQHLSSDTPALSSVRPILCPLKIWGTHSLTNKSSAWESVNFNPLSIRRNCHAVVVFVTRCSVSFSGTGF